MKLFATPATCVAYGYQSRVYAEDGTLVCLAVGLSAREADERAALIVSNNSKVGALVNRVKKLEDALHPFAEYAATLGDALPDNAPVTNGLRGPGRIAVGACRAALRARDAGRTKKAHDAGRTRQ